MFNLQPLRHISTLPKATELLGHRELSQGANKRHLGTCNASTPRRPGRFKSVRSQNPCKVSEGQSPITPVGRLFDPPGACAVQPRSKVSIGNIAVNDFCFG